jgi:aryl-alcohol dehydrogenase-like predicted oxidoreductase
LTSSTPPNRSLDIAAVTAHFNVVDRQQSPLLEATIAAGAIFVPWQPVSLKAPRIETDTNGPEDVRRDMEPVAARHGATIPQIALAWLLHRSPAILPIPAATSLDHVKSNLAAQHIELSDSDLRVLDSLA